MNVFVSIRLVPDGKPQVTAAHNTSSTSISITWKPPPRSSIHGEFLGYRLAYKKRDTGAEFVHEIFLRDPNIEVCTHSDSFHLIIELIASILLFVNRTHNQPFQL